LEEIRKTFGTGGNIVRVEKTMFEPETGRRLTRKMQISGPDIATRQGHETIH
jgi:hypothetical protein